tara:strand:+ start:3920 stop:4570 length:651 start_codon:yes stop_codon:yes gene_type:complete
VNIILFGPPGAGKGTQANNLIKNYNLFKVSTGDLLRNEVKNRTALGVKIESVINKGSLVSDGIINDLITKILSDSKFANRIVFDGYPRNLNQTKALEQLMNKYNQKISCVLSLEVEKEIVIKRILGRQICSKCGLIFNEYFSPSNNKNHKCDSKFLQKRSDDSEKTVKDRFDTYLEKTLPILNFYKKQNLLHQINGSAKITDIYKEIQGIITSIET